jgi:hypothetical protein
MKLKNLQYMVKERINLFALNNVRDYENLQIVNKHMDYEPCEFSYPQNVNAEQNYNLLIEKLNEKLLIDSQKLIMDYTEELMYEFCKLYRIKQISYNSFNNLVLIYGCEGKNVEVPKKIEILLIVSLLITACNFIKDESIKVHSVSVTVISLLTESY